MILILYLISILLIMKFEYIPKDLLHIILEYDGRIKYKNGKYINVIQKNDQRYNIIKLIISKKIKILKNIVVIGCNFYFRVGFNISNIVGLSYDYGFNNYNTFEICYYDFRNEFKQIRTYL